LDQPFVDAVQACIEHPVQPLELFNYQYAASYSPEYRQTFADELRRGFPRIPLPESAAGFARLAELGQALVNLHLGRVGPAAPEAGLPPAKEVVSVFRLGGYDVLRRWQGPRRLADEVELARLAVIGRETRRLMREIDGTRSVPATYAYPTETGSSA
jgi:hypothetical protein